MKNMFCSKCGTKNGDGAKFCKNCGVQMGTVENAPEPTPTVTSANKPKSVLFYALAPIGGFIALVALWGVVNVVADTDNPSALYSFFNNVLVPLLFAVFFLAIPVGIIYAIYSNSKNYDGTIKCGNCNYVGAGKKGRSTWAQVVVWLLFFFFWPITLIYYLVTHSYECPKCGSTFIGLRDKTGAYSAPRSGLGPLGIVLIAFLVIAIIGILASVVLASLNSARDMGQDASTKQALANAYSHAKLYYIDNNSYEGLCADFQYKLEDKQNTSASGVYDICNDTSSGFVVTAPLNEGGYYCIDKWNDGIVVDERIYASQSTCPKASIKN